MNLRRALALAAIAILAAGAAGCSTVEKVNPFHKDEPNKVKAAEGERIPLIALNQKLEVSEALKGQSFFLPDPQPVVSWPQPFGTPNQWTENLDAAQGFHISWRRSVGKGSDRDLHLTAPPVAADGRIYVMDAEAHVSAFDVNTGARVWSVDLAERTHRDREGFSGGLAFDNGKLYVTSGYRFVEAVDAATGRKIWRTNVDAPIHDAPAVANGRVMAINVDDELESFNQETGSVRA